MIQKKVMNSQKWKSSAFRIVGSIGRPFKVLIAVRAPPKGLGLPIRGGVLTRTTFELEVDAMDGVLFLNFDERVGAYHGTTSNVCSGDCEPRTADFSLAPLDTWSRLGG